MTAGRRGRRGPVARFALLLVVAYAAWACTLFFAQRSMLFPRWIANQRPVAPPASIELLRLARPDGVDSIAWLRRGVGDGPRPTIVLLHGNAMLANHWFDWAEELSAGGTHVLIPEFRGYGDAPGSPSRAAIVGDVAAWLAALRSRPEVDPDRIVVHGRSIGAAIGVEAVRADLEAGGPPPSALVLHTPPAPIRSYALRYLLPPFLVRDPFDPIEATAAVAARPDAPAIFVVGHERDDIATPANVRSVAAAAGVEATMLSGDHNRLDSAAEERRLADIIEAALAAEPRRGADRRRSSTSPRSRPVPTSSATQRDARRRRTSSRASDRRGVGARVRRPWVSLPPRCRRSARRRARPLRATRAPARSRCRRSTSRTPGPAHRRARS
jgi:alpha-beta hydrolase superfamily lysophospholipase